MWWFNLGSLLLTQYAERRLFEKIKINAPYCDKEQSTPTNNLIPLSREGGFNNIQGSEVRERFLWYYFNESSRGNFVNDLIRNKSNKIIVISDLNWFNIHPAFITLNLFYSFQFSGIRSYNFKQTKCMSMSSLVTTLRGIPWIDLIYIIG